MQTYGRLPFSSPCPQGLGLPLAEKKNQRVSWGITNTSLRNLRSCVFLNHFTQFEQEDVHLSCPSSVQLPAPSCMLPPPPDILHTFEVPVFPTVSPELTAKAEPGLTPQSLVFNRLLKKFCNNVTSYCACLVEVGTPPSHLLAPPSISASTCSTVGSKKVDEPSVPTRPAVGGAEASTGLRNNATRVAIGAFSS